MTIKTFKIVLEVEMSQEEIDQWTEKSIYPKRAVGVAIGEYIAAEILPLSNTYQMGEMPDIKKITATIPRTKK